MAIKFGDSTPLAFYLGNSTVTALYQGSTQVWPQAVLRGTYIADWNANNIDQYNGGMSRTGSTDPYVASWYRGSMPSQSGWSSYFPVYNGSAPPAYDPAFPNFNYVPKLTQPYYFDFDGQWDQIYSDPVAGQDPVPGAPLPGTFALNVTGSYTVTTWFRTTTGSGARIVGISYNLTLNSPTVAGGSAGREIYVGTNGKLYFTGPLQNFSSPLPMTYLHISSSGVVTDGNWHCATGIYLPASQSSTDRNGRMELYLDGVLASRIIFPSASVFPNSPQFGCTLVAGYGPYTTAWPNMTPDLAYPTQGASYSGSISVIKFDQVGWSGSAAVNYFNESRTTFGI